MQISLLDRNLKRGLSQKMQTESFCKYFNSWERSMYEQELHERNIPITVYLTLFSLSPLRSTIVRVRCHSWRSARHRSLHTARLAHLHQLRPNKNSIYLRVLAKTTAISSQSASMTARSWCISCLRFHIGSLARTSSINSRAFIYTIAGVDSDWLLSSARLQHCANGRCNACSARRSSAPPTLKLNLGNISSSITNNTKSKCFCLFFLKEF